MTRSNLAVGYSALGRHEDAVRLDEETLEAREYVLGPEHLDTLASRHNLAASYSALGRHEDAALLWEETLEVRERVSGAGHADTFSSRINLADSYRALGRDKEANRLDAVALSDRWKLAHDCFLQGRAGEAVVIWEQVFGILEGLAPEDPTTLDFRSNLAMGYRALGRGEDAARLEEETLPMRERIQGPEHPDTLIARDRVAGYYYHHGRPVDAARLWEEMLATLGPKHPDASGTRMNLAACYRALGRDDDAARLEKPGRRFKLWGGN